MAPALEGPPCSLGPPNLRATAAPQGQADRGQVLGWRPWRPTGLQRHGHVAPGGLQSWGTRLRMGGCLGTGITGGRRGGSRQSLRPRRTWLRGAQLSPPLPTGSLQDPGWVRSLLWPLSQGPCVGDHCLGPVLSVRSGTGPLGVAVESWSCVPCCCQEPAWSCHHRELWGDKGWPRLGHMAPYQGLCWA